MNILVTGCAGFIGFHVVEKLLNSKKNNVIGIDNLNNYYDIKLKKDRLKILKSKKRFKFLKIDISNYKILEKNFKNSKYDFVIHLAAQAGVRHSISNPQTYFENNIKGFYNILDISKNNSIKHFIYASSSSVYGATNKFPIKEDFNTDKPLSFYAASKKSNEIIAHSYSSIFKIPTTGLRFFTVFGPYGRPDMALFKFTKNILNGKKIELYNKGIHTRDFTYIDDVVDGITKILNKPSKKNTPYEIYNIGSNNPIKLKVFVKILENLLNKKSKKVFLPLQRGDVKKTHSNINKISKYIRFKPNKNITINIRKFVDWFINYYN